jgi:hypothetical protein
MLQTKGPESIGYKERRSELVRLKLDSWKCLGRGFKAPGLKEDRADPQPIKKPRAARVQGVESLQGRKAARRTAIMHEPPVTVTI